MCGLIGWTGSKLDLESFYRTCLLAGLRGPHGHGFAYSDGSSRLEVKRFPGPVKKRPPEPPEWCRALIGHTRLATAGRWWEVQDHQPIQVDDVVVAHNGNVYNAQELLFDLRVHPSTKNDSEVIAHLILAASDSLPLKERVKWAVQQIDPKSPLSLIVMRRGEVVGIRRNGTDLSAHPLWEIPTGDGYFLCSWPTPGARAIPVGEARSWSMVAA